MNQMAKTINKYGWLAIGIYAFYALFLLLFARESYPLPWAAVVFAVILVLLIVYHQILLWCEKTGKRAAGLDFIHMLRKYRFLIEQLVSRDFKTKYKRSVLGVLWSFLNPLLLMCVQYVVFSQLMKFEVEYYAAYLLSGIVLYNGFSDCANQSMHAITGNSTLITKVYVPKYIYPVSKVLSTVINTVLSMIPLLLIALLNGVKPSFAWLLIPVVLAVLLLFTIGMGFLLSALLVFFRDIEFLWGVFTTLWMYATPIIYPVSILPDWIEPLEVFNPMYHYVTLLRTVVLDGCAPEPVALLNGFVIGLAMLVLGGLVFRKTQDQFILYL